MSGIFVNMMSEEKTSEVTYKWNGHVLELSNGAKIAVPGVVDLKTGGIYCDIFMLAPVKDMRFSFSNKMQNQLIDICVSYEPGKCLKFCVANMIWVENEHDGLRHRSFSVCTQFFLSIFFDGSRVDKILLNAIFYEEMKFVFKWSHGKRDECCILTNLDRKTVDENGKVTVDEKFEINILKYLKDIEISFDYLLLIFASNQQDCNKWSGILRNEKLDYWMPMCFNIKQYDMVFSNGTAKFNYNLREMEKKEKNDWTFLLGAFINDGDYRDGFWIIQEYRSWIKKKYRYLLSKKICDDRFGKSYYGYLLTPKKK